MCRSTRRTIPKGRHPPECKSAAASFDHQRHTHTVRVCKKRTVSSVFWMSGILSFRPAARRCVLTSMNWYLLCATSATVRTFTRLSLHLRNHLLKALKSAFDLIAGGNVVFDFVDERREGYASGIGGRIFAAAQRLGHQSICTIETMLTQLLQSQPSPLASMS